LVFRSDARPRLLARGSGGSLRSVAEEIAATGGPEPQVAQLELGSLESIRRFAQEFSGQRVDLLVNNAGGMMTPRQTTSDGFELQLGTNHLGHTSRSQGSWWAPSSVLTRAAS